MTKILISGINFQSPNRGIQALGYGSIELIKNSFSQEIKIDTIFITPGNTTSLTDNIDQYHLSKADLLNLCFNHFQLTSKKPIIDVFKKSDFHFSINEGDSYSDIYGLKRFFAIWLLNFIQLLHNKKLVFLPQTIGPFFRFPIKMLAKLQLQYVNNIYVRDLNSLHLLDELGIESTLIPDLSLFMKPHKFQITLPKSFIAINPNGILYYGFKKEQIDPVIYKKLLLNTINYLLNKGENVVLIPHVYNKQEPLTADDLQACKELCKEFSGNDSNLLIIDESYNASELKYVISKSKFIIASRMHACIAALSTNKPAIALAYSYKFEGTFTKFKSNDWVIEIFRNQNIKENLFELIDYALINYRKESAKLRPINISLRNEITRNFKI